MSKTFPEKLDGRKVLVIVPAHNEAGNISAVIEDLRTHSPWADVVVVDDFSSDSTADIARSKGAGVLSLACNLNVGGAMQTGYMYAAEKGYDFTVQFDGDGQHRAILISSLIEKLIDDRLDMVIGSRTIDGVKFRFNPLRLIGSRLLGGVISLVTKQNFSDPTSGFKACGRKAVEFFAMYYPQSYLGDTTEALVWAAKHGISIGEVPARMRQRTEGESATNSIKGLFHTLRMVLAILIDWFEEDFVFEYQNAQKDGEK